MKMIQWYIDKINESTTVKLSIRKQAADWKIEVITTWNDGFESIEQFDSLSEVKAYLRGFYDALPF